MKTDVSLVEGNISRGLLRFAMPILFALVLQNLYSSVDMLIVGNFSDIANISGVSTGSQLMSTLTALCVGLAMGITIFIGQKLGENKEEHTNEDITKIISNGMILFGGISIVTMIGFLLYRDGFVKLLNTPADAVIQTSEYIWYCSIGIPMIFMYNMLGSVFRGLGDSKTPLIAVGIACIVNVVGDLILIAGLGMGAGGAAIATVIAQAVSVIVTFYILRKKSIITKKFMQELFIIRVDYIKKILSLGIPVALQSVMATFSVLMFTMIVNEYGILFSAAIGLADKVTGLTVMLPSAFMQALSVFVAQNYGAKNYARAKQGLLVCLKWSFGIGMITAISIFLFGDIMVSIFNRDPELVTAAKQYLNGFALDTCIVTIQFSLVGYFNGYGKTMFVMFQSIVGTLVRIPLVYYMSTLIPTSLFKIGIATPMTTSFQIFMCVAFLIYLERKLRN
ncbi:MAG: MATE family efflux transporter [Eubacteriales bacterium]